jgi:broad specificity phosphatase PhoE
MAERFTTFYFVRHGQTEANLRHVQQDVSDMLTAHGREQAVRVARSLQGKGIAAIITSPLTRTIDTAETIAAELEVPMRVQNNLHEVRRPSLLTGLPRTDDISKQVRGEMWERFTDISWRHSDEENFVDQVERAKSAVEVLEQVQEQVVCVVTHALFLRVMMWHMCFREQLTPMLYRELYAFYGLANAGISSFIYDHERKRWMLIQWNLMDHLPIEDQHPSLLA